MAKRSPKPQVAEFRPPEGHPAATPPAPEPAAPTRTRKPPRARALPGLEQVRDEELDGACERIGDIREKLAALRQSEKEEKKFCQDRMHGLKLKAHKHAGVELLLVPGDEKLRVRLTGDEGQIAAE
jgi:hypothetical protein